MAAKITFKGKPDQDEITFRRVTFKKGEEVEVTDSETIRKLRNHPDFTVVPDKPPENGGAEEPQLVPAPSTVSAQHPVPKPGEPIPVVETPAPEGPKVQPLKPIPRAHK